MGGIPVFLMARPGMHGSSGNHASDRHSEAEVALLDAALSQLRERYGFTGLVLYGFSSGGAIVANLLGRRQDIRCAVIVSAPLDLGRILQRAGQTSEYFAMRRGDLADPIDTVRDTRSEATIIVIGDRRDRNVSAGHRGATGWPPRGEAGCMWPARKSSAWNARNSAAPSKPTTTPQAAGWRWPMAASPACRSTACCAACDRGRRSSCRMAAA